MKRRYAFEDEDDGIEGNEGYNFTIELTHSMDGKQITIVILSGEKMSARAFVAALMDYAKNFEEFQEGAELGESVN